MTMTASTNIDAQAVRTLAWLAATPATIVVPVYQRQYRWEISGCAQLLEDVRAAADGDERRTHFIGSILSSAGEADELVLIDGQQRLTTLMLLVAALRHTVQDADPALADELGRSLVHDDDPGRTKLRPHRSWAGAFERVVLGRSEPGAADGRFAENYTYFRSQIGADEASRIHRGLQRLEHVSITLAAEANAQQVFESLNSTGAPLRDHELIHNYVLMGLTHAEQLAVEDEFWLPIERATGESIDAFFRDYLVLASGREPAAGDRAVYDAFRREFPTLAGAALREHAAVWREHAEVYRVLLDPAQAPDAGIGRLVAGVAALGRGMFPLAMLALHAHRGGTIDRGRLVLVLERIQSLLLRRMVVGVGGARLVARLCRKWDDGPEELARAFARITPSDLRVRLALRYRALPHPALVLGRIAGLDGVDGLLVDRVFPPAPADAWTGDGVRLWRDLSDDEQNSLRALGPTIGNLALLESELAEATFDLDFPRKQQAAYARSALPGTRALAELPAWGSAAISDRTGSLADEFLRVWPRDDAAPIDDDGLTPILDAVRRSGWFPGWREEYDYVEYRGEHWEVYDIKHLFTRVYRRLWADRADEVLAFSARNRGPVFAAEAFAGEWAELPAGPDRPAACLYAGSAPQYLLDDLQGLLVALGVADEVFVRYSWSAR